MYAEVKIQYLQRIIDEYDKKISELTERNRYLEKKIEEITQYKRKSSEHITANTSFDELDLWISTRNARRPVLARRYTYNPKLL